MLGLGGHDNSGSKGAAVLNTDPHGLLYRIVAVVAGFAIIGFGAFPLLQRGDLFSTKLVWRTRLRTAGDWSRPDGDCVRFIQAGVANGKAG